jgi:hypothetical protein
MTEKISQKNWEMSRDKWEAIVKAIPNHSRISRETRCTLLDAECGYCNQYFHHEFEEDVNPCKHCPLFQKHLCINSPENEPRLSYAYWVVSHCEWSNDKVLPAAQKILAAIMEDEPNAKPEIVSDGIHTLFHTLWTKAVGTPNYSRTEWQDLQNMLKELGIKKI